MSGIRCEDELRTGSINYKCETWDVCSGICLLRFVAVGEDGWIKTELKKKGPTMEYYGTMSTECYVFRCVLIALVDFDCTDSEIFLRGVQDFV